MNPKSWNELRQLWSCGFITPSQFHGVNDSEQIIQENRLYHPEAQFRLGNWVDVIWNEPRFNPGFIYLDTQYIVGHKPMARIAEATLTLCPRDTFVVINGELNNPYSCATKRSEDSLLEVFSRCFAIVKGWEQVTTFQYRSSYHSLMKSFMIYRR